MPGEPCEVVCDVVLTAAGQRPDGLPVQPVLPALPARRAVPGRVRVRQQGWPGLLPAGRRHHR